jgi:hypothetical protein
MSEPANISSRHAPPTRYAMHESTLVLNRRARMENANGRDRMNRILDKATSLAAWTRAGTRLAHRLQTEWQWHRVNRLYEKLGPLTNGAGPQTVMADGLWDNPNHFFRLRLCLEAIPAIGTTRLIGVLGRTDVRTRRSLECLGFTEFITLEDNPHHRTESFRPQAQALLADVRCHADLLSLPLPGELPAYTYYDTVLKLARHPQPALDNPLWETALAECLRNCAIYRDFLESTPVDRVILSHPWKNEFATLMWTALSRGIPAHHLTGYCEGIRIRRFVDTDDYATPVEHLSLDEFTALPTIVRQRLSEEGTRYLAQRESGQGTDINLRYAYRPHAKALSRTEARRALGLTGVRKLAVIYAHVWFDFPHTFAMHNFTDFLDWMRLTLVEARAAPDIDWVLKPHPTERWYGGYQLRDMVGDLPPHIRLAPNNMDSLTALTAADIVVTVHGTVGLEAAAHGIPTIAADRSFYSDWGFVHQAQSREDYISLLRTASDLPAPDEAGRQRARALISLALAPPPSDAGLIEMRCDSSGPILYKDILRRYSQNVPTLAHERERLRTWFTSSSSSYAASTKTEYFREAR